MAHFDLTSSRVAVFAVFVATGLVSATWAARLPATADRLQLDVPSLGLAAAGLEGGALIGLPTGAVLVGRLGARRSLLLAWLVYAGALLPLAVLPSLPALVVGLAVWAAANSVVDVAMNVAGVRLGSLAVLHAGHTLGLLAGGALAAGTAATSLPLAAHFAFVVVGAAAMVSVSMRWISAARTSTGRSESAPGERLLARPPRGLLLLGAVAYCGFLIEGSAAHWVAVHLSTHGTSTPSAAAGYAVVMGAVALARIVGGQLTVRVRRARVVRVCGVLVCCGAVAIVVAPDTSVALAGWIVVGAGVALVAPTVIAAAPDAGAVPPATAIAGVTSVGYLGSFSGPPAIGVLARFSGLPWALALLAVAGLVMVLLAPRALKQAYVSGGCASGVLGTSSGQGGSS